MYSVDDIMKRLKAGEDAETIAQEFIDALNDAIEQKSEEDAAEAAAKAKEDAKEVARRARIADAWDVVDPLNVWLKEYYPELAKNEVKPEELVDLFDSVVELNHTLGMLKLTSFPFQKKEKCEDKKICKRAASTDEVIKKFVDSLF